MPSVSYVASNATQPKGGYFPLDLFFTHNFKDDNHLGPENIDSGLIGNVVLFLAQYMATRDSKGTFAPCLLGAKEVGETYNAETLLAAIRGLDNYSIMAATKLVGYEVVFRTHNTTYFKNIGDINPDPITINNIKVMVGRYLTFINDYGPALSYGVSFEDGYSIKASSGLIDVMTKDTLWDLKFSKALPRPKDTLQMALYYLLAKRTNLKNPNSFRNIIGFGIFNPRLNCAMSLKVSKIDPRLLKRLEAELL